MENAPRADRSFEDPDAVETVKKSEALASQRAEAERMVGDFRHSRLRWAYTTYFVAIICMVVLCFLYITRQFQSFLNQQNIILGEVSSTQREMAKLLAEANRIHSKPPSNASLPIGTVVSVVGIGNPPDGWLVCDGRVINKREYPELAEALGYDEDTGDARLPNLRGDAAPNKNSLINIIKSR